jgi:hypothetical protein
VRKILYRKWRVEFDIASATLVVDGVDRRSLHLDEHLVRLHLRHGNLFELEHVLRRPILVVQPRFVNRRHCHSRELSQPLRRRRSTDPTRRSSNTTPELRTSQTTEGNSKRESESLQITSRLDGERIGNLNQRREQDGTGTRSTQCAQLLHRRYRSGHGDRGSIPYGWGVESRNCFGNCCTCQCRATIYCRTRRVRMKSCLIVSNA